MEVENFLYLYLYLYLYLSLSMSLLVDRITRDSRLVKRHMPCWKLAY